MVEKVEAHRTSDGKIFEDLRVAACHEATMELRAFLQLRGTPGGSDTEWADFLVFNATYIHDALDPIIKALRPQAVRSVS